MRNALVMPLCFAIAGALAQCGGQRAQNSGPVTATTAPVSSGGSTVPSATSALQPATAPTIVKDDGKTARPNHKLTAREARRYMLALINRDRKTEGQSPLALDEGAPTIAGQGHAEDMAHLGYLGHWGSDGSVPEERHTRAGGSDIVFENASCFTDEKVRPLDPNPLIDPAEVEHAESMFFNEKPPNDGHRVNILRPHHTHVGIGVAQPGNVEGEISVPCFSQEFADEYGQYDALPIRAKAGSTLHVSGHSAPTATGVGVARIDSPKPIAASELNKRRSYMTPTPYAQYWPPPYVTDIPVKVTGDAFQIDVPLAKGPGLYEISVWTKMPNEKAHSMISLRTLVVE